MAKFFFLNQLRYFSELRRVLLPHQLLSFFRNMFITFTSELAILTRLIVVETYAWYTQPPNNSKPTKSKRNARSASSNNRKPREEIAVEDRRRDARNAERRKIIRRETQARRGSLVHNLLLAKAVIDGHAKNKNFEKKAKERRCVIKTCCSGQGANPRQRRLSFLEELKIAKDVVAPRWDFKQSVEKSMEKCRTIKEQCGGKRRLSLKEQLGVARDVIVDSERRERSLPPEVVQEVSFSLVFLHICLLFVVCFSPISVVHLILSS